MPESTIYADLHAVLATLANMQLPESMDERLLKAYGILTQLQEEYEREVLCCLPL